MNKNQFFNLKRFSNYSRNLLLINAKSILISVAVLFAVMFLLQFSSMPRGKSMVEYPISNYAGYFTFYLLGLGLFIGSGFKALNQKVDTRNYLAVPVSTFEKYLSEFLSRIVIGTIGFLVIFWLAVNSARYVAIFTLTNPIINPFQQIAPFSYKAFFEYVFRGFETFDIVSLILFITSIYITLFNIRLFFNKHGLIKTLLTLSALFSAIITLIYYIGKKFFESSTTRYVNFEINDIYFYIILAVAIVGLSVFGYFKLKEKEL